MAEPPLLKYEEVPEMVLTAEGCGLVVKVFVVLYFGGSSPCRVIHSSVANE